MAYKNLKKYLIAALIMIKCLSCSTDKQVDVEILGFWKFDSVTSNSFETRYFKTDFEILHFMENGKFNSILNSSQTIVDSGKFYVSADTLIRTYRNSENKIKYLINNLENEQLVLKDIYDDTDWEKVYLSRYTNKDH